MTRQYFFGYGSLVNARTHDYPAPRPARLCGWRRAWRPTALRAEAFLSARPCPKESILGLIAEVPNRDWAGLDVRETGYHRHPVSGQVEHDLATAPDVQVYAVPDRHHRPDPQAHILLSYLDVVVQGFLHQFGRDGVDHFFASTENWPAFIDDDRATPRYPRYQTLTGAERALVDSYLDSIASEVRRP